jgi:hypothetical protein
MICLITWALAVVALIVSVLASQLITGRWW